MIDTWHRVVDASNQSKNRDRNSNIKNRWILHSRPSFFLCLICTGIRRALGDQRSQDRPAYNHQAITTNCLALLHIYSGLPKALLLYQRCKVLPQGRWTAGLALCCPAVHLLSSSQMEHSKEQE